MRHGYMNHVCLFVRKNDMVLMAKERLLPDNSTNRTRLGRILFAGQIRKDLAGKYWVVV